MRMKLSIGNESAEMFDAYNQTSFEDSVLAIAEAQGQVCSAEIELHNALVELDSQCMYVENFTEIALTEAAFGYTQSLASLFADELSEAGYGIGNEAGTMAKAKGAMTSAWGSIKAFFAKIVEMLKNFFKFITDRNYRAKAAIEKEIKRVGEIKNMDTEAFEKSENKIMSAADASEYVDVLKQFSDELAANSANDIIGKLASDENALDRVATGRGSIISQLNALGFKAGKDGAGPKDKKTVKVSDGGWNKSKAVAVGEAVAKILAGSGIMDKKAIAVTNAIAQKAVEDAQKTQETAVAEHGKLKGSFAKGTGASEKKEALDASKSKITSAAKNVKYYQKAANELAAALRFYQAKAYQVASDVLVALRAIKEKKAE